MAKKSRKKTFSDRVAEYAHSDRLRQRVKVGNLVSCVIDGNYGTYQTRIVLARGRAKKAECTCPSEYWPCKHASALALTYKEAPESFVDVDRLLAKFEKIPAGEMLATMRRMIIAAPACLQALGVKGFEERQEEVWD
ncbi:MAG: SWIM zinc finger family protein [Elusimicrobia bacterium]|nr:SWIM zinc finger family protein [Elusimicrobiota bacterium]